MQTIENQIFDEERALYGSNGAEIINCRFDGPADGESALKESKCVIAKDCLFNLRYPLWHCKDVKLSRCEMTDLCRAALWYTDNVSISDSRLMGIKVLRECNAVNIKDTEISSEELGWFCNRIEIENSDITSVYCMLRSKDIVAKNLNFRGKYSFQYIENSVFENCDFDTKDAFWHAKNVTVINSKVKGEYLAWYSENVTFIDCEIIGTQPLCYCKGLRLVNCTMTDTDLSFEKSEVEATLENAPISIKNPLSGYIEYVGDTEIILDTPTECKILCTAMS